MTAQVLYRPPDPEVVNKQLRLGRDAPGTSRATNWPSSRSPWSTEKGEGCRPRSYRLKSDLPSFTGDTQGRRRCDLRRRRCSCPRQGDRCPVPRRPVDRRRPAPLQAARPHETHGRAFSRTRPVVSRRTPAPGSSRPTNPGPGRAAISTKLGCPVPNVGAAPIQCSSGARRALWT